jgi:hypothetical protein
MQSKELIFAMTGLLVLTLGLTPSIGRTATPCPPPQVDVEGGTSASTTCTIVSGNSYSTNFPATENPLSDGGKWINGKTVGLDWNNVRTIPGKAYPAEFVGTGDNRYADDIAHLNTSFTANQYAQATAFRVPGYMNSPDKHEIELLLRFKITAHSARGYEVLWGQDGGICVVRWNGPLASYSLLGNCTGASPSMVAVTGDVLRAEITGSVIKVFKNGSLVISVSDSTYTDGQPGIGFWPPPGATLDAYAWQSFQAGSL